MIDHVIKAASMYAVAFVLLSTASMGPVPSGVARAEARDARARCVALSGIHLDQTEILSLV